MSVISRTALWTIAVVVACFILAWGIGQHRMQGNGHDADSKQADGQKTANPGGNWPQFHGDQAQSGSVSGNLPEKLSLVWRFKAAGEVKSSPAIVDGRVYFGSSDKHVYALDVQTGKQVWSAILDDMVEASPIVVENVVYIGTLAGTLYALGAGSGSSLWWGGQTGLRILRIGCVSWSEVMMRLYIASMPRPVNLCGHIRPAALSTGPRPWGRDIAYSAVAMR
jgi:glucose dehydrogenase